MSACTIRSRLPYKRALAYECKEQLTTTGTTRHIMNVLTYTFSPYVLYYNCVCTKTPAAMHTRQSRIQWENNASLTASLALSRLGASRDARGVCNATVPNATKIAKADGDLDARVSSCSATWSQFGKWHRGELSRPWCLPTEVKIPILCTFLLILGSRMKQKFLGADVFKEHNYWNK